MTEQDLGEDILFEQQARSKQLIDLIKSEGRGGEGGHMSASILFQEEVQRLVVERQVRTIVLNLFVCESCFHGSCMNSLGSLFVLDKTF